MHQHNQLEEEFQVTTFRTLKIYELDLAGDYIFIFKFKLSMTKYAEINLYLGQSEGKNLLSYN